MGRRPRERRRGRCALGGEGLNRLLDLGLIGLDWGSSNVRAFAFNRQGEVIAARHSQLGAMKLAGNNAFEQAFDDLVGDWCAANSRTSCYAAGMVGARGAWIESGYVNADADAKTLRGNTVPIVTRSGFTVAVIPGLKSDEPDVMRGEETQVIGANVRDGVVVLPGTHSKWALVRNGRIASFKTALTGEMNALLREQSTIGKSLKTPPTLAHCAAIARGIERAKSHADWLHQLFLFRAHVVANVYDDAEVSSELSAWLIASEFVQMQALGFAKTHIHLIASDTLSDWYLTVATAFGVECLVQSGETCAARGLWAIANAGSQPL
jgi:2-dehydro-3-deoxygalactonokinase